MRFRRLLYFFGSQLDVTRRRIAEGALGPALDERRTAQAALQESEAKFRAIAETMPQFVWSTTGEGYHDYYNSRWYAYTGMPRGGSQGWNWKDYLHPDDFERTVEVWQECLRTGKDYQIEYRFKEAATGRYRWFLARAMPLRDRGGAIVRWLGTCTDIEDQEAARETPFHKARASRLTRTMAAARTKKASADEGVAS